MRYASSSCLARDRARQRLRIEWVFAGSTAPDVFRTYTIGPANKTFNFADGPDKPGLAPEMFWIAKRFIPPALRVERTEAARAKHPCGRVRSEWFNRDAKPPQPPAGRSMRFPGVGMASFRTASDDPNALFLACKGGDNKAGHAHLDLGNFVLDPGNCVGHRIWARVRLTAGSSETACIASAPNRTIRC